MFGSRPGFGSNTSSFSGFGTNTSTGFGSSAFGRPAFGTPTTAASPFGSNTPTGSTSLFGQTQNTGGGLFGSTPQSSFGTSSTGFGTSGGGIFGSSATQSGTSGGLFGTSTSSGFNASQTQTQPFNFGTPTTSSSSTGLFGSSGGSLFGSTVGQQPQQGTTVKYQPVTGTDTMTRGGTSSTIQTKIEVITAMKVYESKSIEELRVDDYLSGRKGPTQGSGFGFGGQDKFGMGQQNKSWLSNTSQSGGGLFGQKQPETKPLFGSSTSTGGFGSSTTSGGLFGSTTPFGQTNTNTSTSGFAFGQQNNQAKPGGFNFNQTTSSTIFGTPSASQSGTTFGANSGFSFGQNQSNGLFGSQNKPVFGPSTSSTGLFGNKPAGTGFNSFGTASSAPFGTTNTSTGSTLFGSQNQNKPAFSLGTGTTGFGASTPNFGSGGLFGSNTNQNKPGGLNFGSSGGFGTNTSLGFNFNQPNTGTGTGLFGNTGGGGLFGSSNATLNTGSSFGNSLGGTGFGGGGLNLFQPTSQNNVNNNVVNNNNITNLIKALTHKPFGTSSLLKNITAPTGKADELLNSATNANSSAESSKTSASKKPTYVLPTGIGNIPKPKPVNRMVNGQSELDTKSLLFAGLEDKNYSISDDPFKPKSFPSVKKLKLRVFKNAKDNVCQSASNSSVTNENSNAPTPLTTPITSPNTSDIMNRNSPLQENSPTIDIIKGRNNIKRLNIVNKGNMNDTYAELNVAAKTSLDANNASLLSSEFDRTSTDINKDHSIAISENSLIEDYADCSANLQTPHAAGIKLHRAGYYTIPSMEDLAEMVSEDGSCLVENFTIGRYGYGNICFQGVTDVSNLDLDSIVFIVRKEVEVYPEGTEKPKIGERLNKAAYVTLDFVWPYDKSSHEVIKSVERLDAMGWSDYLERQCMKMEATFVEYRPETGSWVFKVKHFSKYGLQDDTNDDTLVVGQSVTDKTAPSATEAKAKENISPPVSSSVSTSTIISSTASVSKVSHPPSSTYQVAMPLFTSRNTSYHGPPATGLTSPPLSGHFSQMIQETLAPKAPVYLDGSMAELTNKDLYEHPLNEIDESDIISPLSPSAERLTVLSKAPPRAIQSLKSHLFFDDFEDEEDQSQKGEKRNVSDFIDPHFHNNFYEDASLVNLKESSKKLLIGDESDIETTQLDERSLYSGPSNKQSELLKSVRCTDEPRVEPLADVCRLREPKTKYQVLSSSHQVDAESARNITQHLGYKIPLESSLLSKSNNCICDAAAFMGRSFRVGWGPGWTLIHTGNTLATSQSTEVTADEDDVASPGAINQDHRSFLFPENVSSTYHLPVPSSETKKFSVTIDKICLDVVDKGAEIDKLDYLIESCLENVLECSTIVTAENKENSKFLCPHFVPTKGINLLHRLAITAAQIEDSERRDQTFSSIFDLCVALWGQLEFYSPETDGDSEYIRAQARKEALSQWIEEMSEAYVAVECERALAEDDESYLDAIFSHMTARQISEACNLAQDKGDHHLALLLSQCCLGDEIPRQIMSQQLSNWTWTGHDEFISVPRLILYSLMAGQPTHKSSVTKINTCTGLDWRRALALHLWYFCPTTSTIAEVLTEYEKAAGLIPNKEDKYCEKPLPPYFESVPMPENLKVNYDVCFQLIKLYVDPSHSLESLLQNFSITPDPMDVTCSWLLWCVLQSLDYTHLNKAKVEVLHTSMAALLEACGQWHWAAFVILCMPEEQKRRRDLSELLNRHLLIEGEKGKNDPFYREKEHFLLHDLKLSEEWLYRAKAIRARCLKKVDEEAWYLIKAGDYNAAHTLVVNFIAPNAVINEDHEHLLSYLNSFSNEAVQSKVTDWTSGGGIYLNYLQVIQQVEELKKTRQPTGSSVERLRPKLLALCTRLNNLKCTSAVHRLSISEMSRMVVSVLRAILSEEPDGIRVLAQQVSSLPLAHECALEELNQITHQYLTQVASLSS